MLTDKMIESIQALQHMYPDKRSLVMGALWVVQRARGWKLTQVDLKDVARLLDISPVEAQAAASFYSMYNIAEPAGGRYHIQVCQNISCSLLGADDLLDHLEETLEIKPGQTTPDKRFSLSTVECLGSCGTAPVMQVNDEYHENLTVESIDRILAGLK